jgi:hypothetical protein
MRSVSGLGSAGDPSEPAEGTVAVIMDLRPWCGKEWCQTIKYIDWANREASNDIGPIG